MNIGRQWSDRLRMWAEAFPHFYYRETAPIELSFFTTMDHLPYDQALSGNFVPAPAGTKWGKKWEYGWFRGQIVIPEALEGKRVVFTLNSAEEMLVWVNGQESGAIDKKHRFITLTRCAKAGTVYDIVAECYAGHGLRSEGAGPVPHGVESIPEPPALQVTVGASHFGVWNEELFQVAMDYLTLYSLVQQLPEKSLRTMKIVEGLKKFTYIADFELPEPELTASVVEAGKVLKPLLECKNGSTAPEYTIFGQSHLDLAWLWTLEETMRKTARTYSNQLALMEEYPEYAFLLCEPPILEWLKELYPNVYDRVLEKVRSGNFYPEGALWVEFDTNIPSGEGLIRQFVKGKRWFRSELGVDSKMAWMPDTFGFNGALPQIMKKCQVPYFATQKLTRQDPEAEPFPYNVFWWEGIDGTKVLSHLFRRSNAVFTPGELITRWEEHRIQQENIDGLIFPFGHGDGGGGPTREMLEMVRRSADLEGAPRCRMEHPVKFFERQENVENTFRGELYLAWHRGTFTSQAKTKRGIRKAEIALKQAEYALSRWLLSGKPIPREWTEELERLWKLLLLNHFHDIAPGSSIARVHERAEQELQEVVDCCDRLLSKMLGDEAQAVHNPHSWPVTVNGTQIPAQSSATIPAREGCGTAVVSACEEGWVLENKNLRCVIDPKGELISVKKPGSDTEYLAGAGNRFLMYKDVNTCYDAWEMGSMYENLPVELDAAASIKTFAYENGAGLLVEKQLGVSKLTQLIVLGHDDVRLDFSTRIDWQEKHKLLKVAFPVNAYSNDAYCETQFGYVKRPVHRSYQTDRDRYEVCNHRYTALSDGAHGAAVLNDGKYGVSVVDNEIRLTLLKAAMMPDQNADRGVQEFTYALYPFDGAFQNSDTVQQAAELNEGILFGSAADDLGPIFLADKKNIVVDTIKPADTVENALLVRAYESMGMRTNAAFTAAKNITKIVQTDMLEEDPEAVDLKNVEFGPFEIKTFILYL